MRILSAHTSPIGSIAISPDGARLAEGVKNGKVRVWNLARGELEFEGKDWGVERPVRVAFSPDGRFLDVASTWITRVSLPDFARDSKQDLLTTFGMVDSVAHAPSGRELLLVNYRYLRLSSSWEKLPAFPFPDLWRPQSSDQTCRAAAYSPDGSRVAIAVTRRVGRGHAALVFDPNENRHVQTLTWDKHEAKRLSFHPSLPLLAAACGPVLRVWNLDTNAEVAALQVGKLHHMGAAFSPCGRYLAAVSKDRTVRFWDAATFAEARRFDWQIGKLLDLAFTPDGTVCAVASDSGKILLFDVD